MSGETANADESDAPPPPHYETPETIGDRYSSMVSRPTPDVLRANGGVRRGKLRRAC
jgi:hypothetical protein